MTQPSPTTTRAATPGARVRAQAAFEVGTLLRNGEQLLVSIVLPVMALIALNATSVPSLGPGRRIDVATAGVLALSVISSAFTAQAIATGFDRRYAVLRYLGVTPLGRSGLVAAKVLATLLIVAIQLVVIGGVGAVLGWRPELAGLPYAVVFVALGTWAFVALALLLAGTLRAEAVLALANLIWVVLLVAGGVIVPRGELPGVLGVVATALPSSALADGLRAALVDGRFDVAAVSVLLGWGVLATTLASRWFRWSD